MARAALLLLGFAACGFKSSARPIDAGPGTPDAAPADAALNDAAWECSEASECPDFDEPCAPVTCEAHVCVVDMIAEGEEVAEQEPGDCHTLKCDGMGGVDDVIDDDDKPEDNESCTNDLCTDGAPSHTFVDDGITCGIAPQVCDGMGHCIGCLVPETCPGDPDDECKTRTCELETCGFDFAAPGTDLTEQDDGDCVIRECDGVGNVDDNPDLDDLPVDEFECTANVCNGMGASNPPVPAGTACVDEAGLFCDGVDTCVERCEDNKKDGPETDIDCGGDCATTCGNGKTCSDDDDCTSDMCHEGICRANLNTCTLANSTDLTNLTSVTILFGGGVGNAYVGRCLIVADGTEVTWSGSFGAHPLVAGIVVGAAKIPDANSQVPTTVGGTDMMITVDEGRVPFYCNVHGGGGMNGALFVVP